jgi:antitoxin (DNA-binding transcriptional repressor) of toxin-antitoxin stability system
MMRRINGQQAKKTLGRLLDTVYANNDQYVIERGGRPVAAVVPVWQLEEWRARRARFFGMIAEAQRRNRRTKAATIEREVARAVKAVRATPERGPG